MHTSVVTVTFLLGLGISAAAAAAPSGELQVIDPGHATLTLTLRSTSVEAAEVVAPIELPYGMVATRLRVSAAGADMRSTTVAAGEGRGDYDAIVARLKDPALLELVGDRRATLHVYPVRRDAPATVVIELTARSLANAHELAYLDQATSLFAVPAGAAFEPETDAYANYWPQHAHPAVDVQVASRVRHDNKS